MIRLRLLGSVELTRADGTEARSVLTQPKRLALLAYLAVGAPRGFHRRDSLLALFWPDADDAHARNALGQSLHFLRRALGAEVIPSRGDDEVGLDLERIEVDVLDFERLVRAGDTSGALERFRGEFMQGFHVSDLSDVEHWLEEERARLGHLAWDAAVKHAEEAAEAGDLMSAVAFARRAVSIRPANEASVVLLMTLLHRSGDRAGALEVFRRLEQELRDEYDAEPEPATLALSEQIRLSPEALKDDEPQGVPESPAEAGPDDQWTAAASVAPPPAAAPVRAPSVRRPWAHRGLVLAGAVAALSLGAAVYGRLRRPPVPTDGALPRAILTDFADATDEGLGPVVTEALRIDLERSRVLDLMEATEVADALSRLRVGPGTGLTAELGRDIARREGIGAVIEGAVASAGTSYIITATLRDAETGEALNGFRVNAAGSGDLIGAIDQLSHDLRRRSGESLRSLRPEEPLAAVTTTSLEALRLYTEGVKAFIELNDRPRAARLQEQAVLLDPDFAMAWRQLFVALQGSGNRARRAEAITQAFEHRHHLPMVERYLVEADYDVAVLGDGPAAVAAFEALLLIDPENPTALNNLGLQYRYVDDLDRAEEVLRRAVAGPGRTSSAYLNLFFTELSRDRGDEAATVLADMLAAYPDFAVPAYWRFQLSFTRGDLAGAAEDARQLSDDATQPAAQRAAGMRFLAMLAQWSGRLQEARELFLRAEAMGAEDDPALAWARRTVTSYDEALVGDPGWARAHLHEGMDEALATLTSRDPGNRDAALALASAGEAEGADRILRAWLATVPTTARTPAETAQRAELGRTALYVRALVGGREDASEPLQRLPTRTRCEDACWAFAKARYHDALGLRAEAAAGYERVRVGRYTNWGLNTAERLHAMMRLGPLYEELGDTTKAIQAYRRMVDQWAAADKRGQETVTRFRERILALGG